MKLFWSLTLLLFYSHAVPADAECNGDICVTVQTTAIDCSKSSSSDYLSHCIATLAYDITNDSANDAETSISCTVNINYLKSVMGIRDTSRQHKRQHHNVSANSQNHFEMPVEFKFATQTEASNVAIKSTTCRIEPA